MFKVDIFCPSFDCFSVTWISSQSWGSFRARRPLITRSTLESRGTKRTNISFCARWSSITLFTRRSRHSLK